MAEQRIVQHRRGTTAEWEQYKHVVLNEGEIAVEFCDDNTAILKVGDGVRPYSELTDIGVSREKIEEIIKESNDTEKLEDLYYELLGKTQAVETNFTTLRESVNTQIEEALSKGTGADGLEYMENILYLKSGDQVISSVEIVGGTGGGGSGSYVDYDLQSNMADHNITVGKNAPCNIDFNFISIKMPQERPTGKITAEIIVGGIAKQRYSLEQGDNSINIQDALIAGENQVTLQCSDTYGNSLSLVYNIKVIELTVTSIFDDTYIQESSITFKYTPFGLLDKTIYFYVDDKEVGSSSVSSSGIQQTQQLPKQSHGVHKLEVFSEAVVNGTTIRSESLIYEFISIEPQNPTVVISTIFDTHTAQQGDLMSIPYVVYDPSSPTSEVNLSLYVLESDGYTLYNTSKLTVNRQKQYWTTRNVPVGEIMFEISSGAVVRKHYVSVMESDLKVESVKTDLQLALTAAGRSNNEIDPSSWTFEDITTTFDNFNWKSNGWVTDTAGSTCLRLNGDARATINFEPFKEDLKTFGKTVELDFSVKDVNKRDEVVVDCLSGGLGIQVTSDTAILKTDGGNLSCNYKENTRVRVTFTVERKADGTRFVSIYLDGVLSGITQYAESTNLQQNPSSKINLGSSYCGLDLYAVRVYSTALTPKQVLQNYIADTEDFTVKAQIHDDNDIYDSYTGLLSYTKLKEKVPTITFIGSMPKFKGDKKKNKVRMIFEHPTKPELNFDEILAQIDVQGTSSAGYVRKNWKTKHNANRTHMEGEIPAKVFCIKVDYAEGTGTHNTQNANFVETLYDQKILPQYDDERVRTTITGFPIVIFHLDTEDMNLVTNITKEELSQRTDVVFSSKGNFNYDKDAESAFGFTDDYDTECWEFCNNTSDSVRFLSPIPEDYASDFEARYHKDIGDLEDLEDADVKDEVAIKNLRASMISRFKQMHDWVVSTNRNKATNAQLEETFVDNVGKEYTHDTAEYRIAKFQKEFSTYFDPHYTAIYYVYTFFALMVDQRAKNFFLTYWHDRDRDGNILDTGKWYPYFYDNDTSYGINNEGQKVFDYFHEDGDVVDGKYVYNGADSVLWCNFRESYAKLIRDTYASLRSDGKLTEDKLIKQVIENGSDMWSASVYNEDAEYKYVSLARPDYDPDGDGTPNPASTYLYQVTGNGEHHFKYFVNNRLRYCDSKWYAGNYFEDQIYLRIYTPKLATYTEGMTDEEKAAVDLKNEITSKSIEAVPPNGNISVTPYSDIYAGVRYKAVSGDDITLNLQQQRALKGKQVTFNAPTDAQSGKQEEFNDTETYIYGASDLSSLGDLSPLYCGYIDVARATKLTHLQIGNSNPDYSNLNLHKLSVGANALLKSIDISNCSGLKDTLDVSKCTNIEEIYAKGSSIPSVFLPESGYVRVLHLPETVNNLTIRNQLYIEDLQFENYSNLTSLCIENCPTIPSTDILNNCKDADGKFTLQRLRLTNIDWELDDVSFLRSLDKLQGIDESNSNTPHAYLEGKCRIANLTGDDMAYVRETYPYLEILFDELTFTATYMNEEGTKELYKYEITVYDGSSKDAATIKDPVKDGLISTPTKDPTASTTYEFAGWSVSPNGTAQDFALDNIISNVTRYVAFAPKIRQYTVAFYNGVELLTEVQVDYGKDASYEDTSSITVSGTKIPYVFDAWLPQPISVTEDMICYAQFKLDASKVETCSEDNLILSGKNSSKKTIHVNGYTGESNVIRIPSLVMVDGEQYTVTEIAGFKESSIVFVDLPETLERIGASAFEQCEQLERIHIPDSVTDIGDYAFYNCSSLLEILLPPNLEIVSDHMLCGCSNLKHVELPSTVKRMMLMCLYRSGIEYILIPENVEYIDTYSFRYCSKLTRVDIHSSKCHINKDILSETPKGIVINVPWSEGDVPNAPWGANNAIINYNVEFNY